MNSCSSISNDSFDSQQEENSTKNTPWTAQEDRKLLEAKQIYPKNDQWMQIATYLGTRNDIQVEKRWNYLVKLQRKIKKSKLSIIDTLHKEESTLIKKETKKKVTQNVKNRKENNTKKKKNNKSNKTGQLQEQRRPKKTKAKAVSAYHSKIKAAMEIDRSLIKANEMDYIEKGFSIEMDQPTNVISIDDNEEEKGTGNQQAHSQLSHSIWSTETSEPLRYRPLLSLQCRCRCPVHCPTVSNNSTDCNSQQLPRAFNPPWYRPYQDRWSLSFRRRLHLTKRGPYEVQASSYGLDDVEEEDLLPSSMVFSSFPK
jgi:ssRNA-specific RNase YbeY (16S rRNA maturation enzyme)